MSPLPGFPSWFPGFVFLWIIAMFPVAAGRTALRQVDRFPAPEQVLADHADPSERYAALKIVHDALRNSTQGAPTPPVASRLAAYYNAMIDVDFVRNQQPDAPAYGERVRQLLGDAAFSQGVLARYRIGGSSPSSSMAAGDAPDELDLALRRNRPYWWGVVAILVLLAPVAVLLFDRRRLPASPQAAEWAPLPESLRSIEVLGRRYDVVLLSGSVVDKETTVEQRVHVSTTGGGATVTDGVVNVAPTQVHVQTDVTRKDLLWVRDAAGRDRAWNLTNAALQARAGHALSAVARHDATGQADFLLAYNHATGQMDSFDGLDRAHRPRRLAAWAATTVAGACGILIAMFALVDLSAAEYGSGLLLLSNWTYPLAIAGVAAAITVGISAWLVGGMRTRIFRRKYLPGFRRFLEGRAA